MSYTKLNKEIEKIYKSNNKSFTYNATKETKKEQNIRLKEYDNVRDIVIKKWLTEHKYKELISIAHRGWFKESELLIPLANYFIKEKKLDCLKYLCERGIRFAIEDTLSSLKEMKKNYPEATIVEINAIDLNEYAKAKEYNSIAETAKWNKLALDRTERYINFLKQISDSEYLRYVKGIREKITSIEIKKKDLNGMKFKL